uniref:Uncharacterized protein n=1 Tax=Borrelia turicatae (strain 91E135) TaxID=314724 RepID=A0A0R9PXL8_BORT9|nr:hypothetical protein BTA113a [Borrelia turicatae 91E135]
MRKEILNDESKMSQFITSINIIIIAGGELS